MRIKIYIMNKKEVLHSLFTITFDNEMESELRETIGKIVSLQTLKDSIYNDLCSDSIMKKISRVAPICYKIGDKIFLKGEVKGNHDFIGDGMDLQEAIELYNMSEEMASGDSYTFYVSSTDYFKFATPSEIIRVKKFLNSLN